MISSPASCTKRIFRLLGFMCESCSMQRWCARWISSAITLSSSSESEVVRSIRLKNDLDDCKLLLSSAVLVKFPLCMRKIPKGELTKNG